MLTVALAVFAGAASFAPAGQRGALYIAAAVLLGAVMTTAAVHATSRWPDFDEASRRRFVVLVLGAGLLARLVLVPAPPYTTHDVDRYLWDGAVLARSQDPWRVPPNDVAAADGFRAPVENAHLPTIYPPAAVSLFALVSRAGPAAAPWLWKLLVAFGSAALLLVTKKLLEAERRLSLLPLIAFSPLALFESGVGAHLDILCAALFACALLCFTRHQAVNAGLFLGAAAALKLLPAAAALPLLVAFVGRDRLKFAAACLALPVVTYGAAFAFGFIPIGSLPFFFEKWRFGSLVFPLFEPLLGANALYVALGLGLSCVGYSAVVARTDPLRATSWAMAGPLLASPVVFPWYLLPLSAAMAARPSAFSFSVLLAAPLTYEVVDRFDVDQSWQPASWPLIAIAAAMGAAFLVDVWRRRRAR